MTAYIQKRDGIKRKALNAISLLDINRQRELSMAPGKIIRDM